MLETGEACPQSQKLFCFRENNLLVRNNMFNLKTEIPEIV